MGIVSTGKGVLQVGSLSIPVEIEMETTPVCPHPELNMTWDCSRPWEYTYWCSACKKKIAIDLYQHSLSDRNVQENFAGIIGLAFGEPWATLARESKI